MMISIVMAYYNRRRYLENTLESITKSDYKNYEVILVDDGSDDNHRCEDLVDKYHFLKVHRINKENKNHINPCIAYNIGFEIAKGDIIIIQNPECFHVGDIIQNVYENLSYENDYLVYGCFSLDKTKTSLFLEDINTDVKKFINTSPVSDNNSDGWYQHSLYRPVGYHFTSAIFKKKLDQIGGFDEDFANGIGYDDDEFLRRVRKNCKVKFIDDPYVIHQYHYDETHNSIENWSELVQINRNLWISKR